MSSLLKRRKVHPSILEIIFSFPKTVFFNFKVLPFKKAIKLPIFVSCHTKFIGVNKKNFIVNLDNAHFGMCRIGIAGSENGYLYNKKSLIMIREGGKIIINGSVALGRNIFIHCSNCVLEIGNETKFNNGCYIECINSNITIKENTSFGWNCSIKNFDGHHIIENGIYKKNCDSITIGSHCWICSNSTILKGTSLGNDCVLAYGSLLTKTPNVENNVLYAGVPAKIIKTNINWSEKDYIEEVDK